MSKNTDKIAVVFAIVVIAVWVLAVIGGIYRRDWTALSIITPVVITMASWLYIRKGNGSGK